jgi:hypothetical protein
MNCYCMWRTCGWGGWSKIMYLPHKEVSSQYGVHISCLTQLGSSRGTVCNSWGPLLLSQAHTFSFLVHMKLLDWWQRSVCYWACCKCGPVDNGDISSWCTFLKSVGMAISARYSPHFFQIRGKENTREKHLWAPGTPAQKFDSTLPYNARSFSSPELLAAFPLSLQHLGCMGDRRGENKNLWGILEPPRRPASNPVLRPVHIIGEGLKNTNSPLPPGKIKGTFTHSLNSEK